MAYREKLRQEQLAKAAPVKSQTDLLKEAKRAQLLSSIGNIVLVPKQSALTGKIGIYEPTTDETYT